MQRLIEARAVYGRSFAPSSTTTGDRFLSRLRDVFRAVNTIINVVVVVFRVSDPALAHDGAGA